METKDHSGTKPWLQFYDEGVPPSIEYPSIPLDRLLEEAAAKHPEHPAIIFGGRVGSRPTISLMRRSTVLLSRCKAWE